MASLGPMAALHKSKAECLKAYLQGNGKPYDKLVTGAIILKANRNGTSNILMLKRAAHEESYHNQFEIPGGKFEDSDPFLGAAIKREVYEETGMVLKDIVGFVRPFEYTMEKKVVEGGEERSVSDTLLQLNYICEVADYKLTLDPKEHSGWSFVALSEVRHMEMTGAMRAVVLAALAWADGYLAALIATRRQNAGTWHESLHAMLRGILTG
ncbi:MAG: hypothetical protein Q9226_001288 [Calogaya cf. arnoldii]